MQRIGSKSHSVDDDDAAPAGDDDVAKQAASASAAEAEEELRLVNDRLVTARLREANLLAHLKDYRQRADDLRRLASSFPSIGRFYGASEKHMLQSGGATKLQKPEDMAVMNEWWWWWRW